MISHIHGTLKKKNPGDQPSIEVDVGGIWYEIDLPVFVWRGFEDQELDTEVDLETFYYVSERQPTPRIVGFTREIERDFFKKFIEVPKVGPSMATKALIFSVSTVAAWIENEDKASLKSLPGIGTRTADTIIAQLKGKVYEEAILQDEQFDSDAPKPEAPTLDGVKVQVVEGLARLGFQRAEAGRLVDQIIKEQALDDPEEIIRAVFAMRSKELV